MSTQSKTRITAQEYLALERTAEIRCEYFDGEMFEMSGARREHNKIVVNIATELDTQFVDRPCEVHAVDLRTKVSQTGLYTYADIVAICGEPQFEDAHFDTLLNPNLIIEVLSDSTESYDRGKKFAHYRTIDSPHEYVLVSQTECRIERFIRQDDGNCSIAKTQILTAQLNSLPSLAGFLCPACTTKLISSARRVNKTACQFTEPCNSGSTRVRAPAVHAPQPAASSARRDLELHHDFESHLLCARRLMLIRFFKTGGPEMLRMMDQPKRRKEAA